MSGVTAAGELITPLVSYPQPAGSHQQVMSPTLGQGYGTTIQQPSPPPGRDGLQQAPGSTPTLAQGQTGGMGFEPMATGGALGGIDQTGVCADSGGMPQVSTVNAGGDRAQMVVPVSGNVAPGESPGLEASPGMLGTVSGDAEPRGRVVTGASAEGFVTPRSQPGIPCIRAPAHDEGWGLFSCSTH